MTNKLLKVTALMCIAAGIWIAPTPAFADRGDPRVRLVEPERGKRRFTAPATIPIEARAEASGGRTIVRVEFFADGQPIGKVATAPYEIAWTNVPEGQHRLRARATDSRGARDWSQTVVVRVQENREPRVRLVSPHARARFTAPATIELEARARDRDHNLARVEFYADGVLLGVDETSPYRLTWSPVAAGRYVLTAKAVDALGATDTSRPVPIEVQGNQAPSVGITSPAANAQFTAPANVPITAEAADADGTVARVDFFVNGAPVGSSTERPFSVTVSNLSEGIYTLTAVVTDNVGIQTISSPVMITVIATAALAQVYFIHTDHLNTPRLITNQVGQAVWSWENADPFGNNVPNENPSGLGTFTCNLWLPGQYFDQETNLHYNYFRDYDPAIGRYIQSDPIGLDGGINTYLYVGANPIKYYDPFGLDRSGDQQVDPWYPRSKKPPFHVRPDGQPWGWGCGDKDTDHVVPDVMWGVNVTPACRKHDHCYERACEPGVTKERCDDDFFKDVRSACRQAGKPAVVCYQLAKSYYDGVRRGGGPSFEAEKKKCCK